MPKKHECIAKLGQGASSISAQPCFKVIAEANFIFDAPSTFIKI
tara:strand:+ start:301 stop:432 length:132 start_codon:yes stop_codon:yes gene_type:complete